MENLYPVEIKDENEAIEFLNANGNWAAPIYVQALIDRFGPKWVEHFSDYETLWKDYCNAGAGDPPGDLCNM